MRRPVKPFHCTPVCPCRCAVLLSVISSFFSDGGGGGVGGFGEQDYWNGSSIFAFSEFLSIFHTKHSNGALLKSKGNTKWLNWSHLNNEADASAVASEKMATIIGSTTGRLQTKVNWYWKKPVGQILNRRWFTANCGLHFKEMFLNRSGAVIMQSILICCLLLGHLISEY